MPDSLSTVVEQFSVVEGRVLSQAANVRVAPPSSAQNGSGRGSLIVLVEVAEGGHMRLYRQLLDAAQAAFEEADGNLGNALRRAVMSVHTTLRAANTAFPEAKWRGGACCACLEGSELSIAQAGSTLVYVSHPKTVEQFPPDVNEDVIPLGGEQRPDVNVYMTVVEPGSVVMLVEGKWLTVTSPETLAAASTAESAAVAVEYLKQLAGEAELNAVALGVGPGVGQAAVGATSLSGASHTMTAGDGNAPPAKGLFGWHKKATPEPVPPTAKPTALPRKEPERPPAVQPPARKRSTFPLVLAAVVIPLLIAGLILAVLWLRSTQRDNDFTAALNGATDAIVSAQGMPVEAQARQSLNRARDFLDKAAALKPGDPALIQTQGRFAEGLAKINRVTPLYNFVPIEDFSDPGHQPARVLVNGNSLYVMDKGRNEILHFVLSDLREVATPFDPKVMLKYGQPVGDMVVNDLVDFTWVEAVTNQRSRLVVLSNNGLLVGYDSTFGAMRVPLGGRDQWGGPKLLGSYNGNLYVVDDKMNKIWRYAPGEKGYEAAPVNYFAKGTNVDLGGVQSMTIDGSIWLLYADGRLLRFFGGEQKPLELRGLPDALNAPCAVVASADGDQLYVADSGNGRIVEFSKDGTFQRQLRPAQGDLKGLKDLYLDETGKMFFILTTDKLYKADLPRPAVTPVGASSVTPGLVAPVVTPPAPQGTPR
jgi:hypothetical protein